MYILRPVSQKRDILKLPSTIIYSEKLSETRDPKLFPCARL